uniref:Family with sequence similarity 13 member C n=1 Tax=Sander lucioperca TaxID=283035 RepID=A0A8D0AS69_SANLU
MFCFCFQSPSLKLQALEVHTPSPHSPESSPVLSTAILFKGISGNDTMPSPPGPKTSPLLSCFTTSDCPVPSPRCPNLSHSLRYNLDPDTAPSPPCSQARSTIHTEPDEGSVSISMLNRHIHSLRKRIRHFEQRFEQEKHYKVREEFKAAWSAGIFCRDWIGSYCLRVGFCLYLQSTRQERTLMKPFYDHYRLLKQLLFSSSAISTVITTIVKLLDHLRTARLEKRRLHQALREFEDHFYTQTGRACQKEDRGPMAEEYCQYKNLKAKLRLLEALLSKQQDSTKTI